MNSAPARTAERIHCPWCKTLLAGPWAEGVEHAVTCGQCTSALLIRAFPALRDAGPNATGSGQRAAEGEATCFFHPEKRAEITCERCGRFLCALCNLGIGTRHLCPTCVSAGTTATPSAVLPEFVQRRVSWPRVSLLLGLLPLIIPLWPFYVMTGPLAIGAALYGWNKPGSLVHGRRRPSAIIGLICGLIQILVIVVIAYFIWRGVTRG